MSFLGLGQLFGGGGEVDSNKDDTIGSDDKTGEPEPVPEHILDALVKEFAPDGITREECQRFWYAHQDGSAKTAPTAPGTTADAPPAEEAEEKKGEEAEDNENKSEDATLKAVRDHLKQFVEWRKMYGLDDLHQNFNSAISEISPTDGDTITAEQNDREAWKLAWELTWDRYEKGKSLFPSVSKDEGAGENINNNKEEEAATTTTQQQYSRKDILLYVFRQDEEAKDESAASKGSENNDNKKSDGAASEEKEEEKEEKAEEEPQEKDEKEKDNEIVLLLFPALMEAYSATPDQHSVAGQIFFDLRCFDRTNPNQKITLCFDCRGSANWPNANIFQLQPIITTFTRHLVEYHPGRLKQIIIFPVPQLAVSIFELFKSMLPPVVKQTTHLIAGNEYNYNVEETAERSGLPLKLMERMEATRKQQQINVC